jgi:hypothetical protein
MGKGITQERIVFLVLAVIFFGLAVFVIFKIFPSLITQIELALGIIKLSNVEKATLCSIYRCVEGCMSMKIQELAWKEGDKTVYCQEFCTGKPYGIDKLPSTNICDPKYPINITLKEKEKIEKSHLVLGLAGVSDVRCILPTNAGGPDIWSILRFSLTSPWQSIINAWKLLTGGTISENILIVDQGIIAGKGNKEDCVAAGTTMIISHDSLQQLTLREGKTIKITSDYQQFGGINVVSTYMAEKDVYDQMI